MGAFTVTFRVREPDNTTIVNVAQNSGNGQNGVTITSQGGGNYTASVNWDPPAGAALGLYDLYFQVSDGAAQATDDYANNNNELTVFSQAAPTFTPGVTAASPATVNRIGTNTIQLSSTWSDPDGQPASGFWVTFSVRQPDNSTIVTPVYSGCCGMLHFYSLVMVRIHICCIC